MHACSLKSTLHLSFQRESLNFYGSCKGALESPFTLELKRAIFQEFDTGQAPSKAQAIASLTNLQALNNLSQ